MKKRKTIFTIIMSLAMILIFMPISMLTVYGENEGLTVSCADLLVGNQSRVIVYYNGQQIDGSSGFQVTIEEEGTSLGHFSGTYGNYFNGDKSGTATITATYNGQTATCTTNITAIAKIGDTEYGKLSTALNNCAEGQKVELLSDYTYAEYNNNSYYLIVQNNAVLDLNNHTLTLPKSGYNNRYMQIKNNSDVTISNGTILTSADNTASYAISVASGSMLTINNMAIESSHYSGVGLGGTLTVGEGTNTIEAKEANQYGININGNSAKITGNGKLTVTGTKGGLKAVYNSVELDAPNVTYQGGDYGMQGDGDGVLAIKAGTFIGTTAGIYDSNVTSYYFGSECNWKITGGKFSSDPGAFLVDGYRSVEPSGSETYWTVIKDANAKGNSVAVINDGSTYLSLYAATTAAESGDTIKLLKDTSVPAAYYIAYPAGRSADALTYDLDGHTLTNDSDQGVQVVSSTNITVKNGIVENTGTFVGMGSSACVYLKDLTINTTGERGYTVEFGDNKGASNNTEYVYILSGHYKGRLRNEITSCDYKGNLIIKGGYFDQDVTEYLAPGYEQVASDESGYSYMVKAEAATPENAVAKIGDTLYVTLDQAIEAASTGETQSVIELLKDVSDSVNIPDNKNIKLTGGHSITGNLTVKTDDLTLGDVTINGSFTVSSSKLTLAGVSINATNSDAIAFSNELVVTVLDGTNNAIHADSSGCDGFYSNSANTDLTINGTGNLIITAGNDAFHLTKSDLTITNPNVNASGKRAIEIGTDSYYSNKATLSGGTYKGTPEVISVRKGYSDYGKDLNDYCATGYEAQSNSDGSYTVLRKPVAQVGEDTYRTLDDALAAIGGNSGTIKILDAIDLSEDPLTESGYANVAPEGKSITLDLNGKAITGGALDVYGTLNLTDSSSGASGSVTGIKHGVYANPGAILNISGGTINGGTNGQAVVAVNGATVNVSGGTVNSGNYYAMLINSSALNVAGGTIKNTNGAGAVYVVNGTLAVENGVVSSTADNTDAIAIAGTTTATISGGTVTGHDWGVVAWDTASLTVSGSAVIGTAADEGYAISTNGNEGQNATVTIKGGTINGEELGIYQPSGKLTVSGGSITGATAVYFKSNSLNITGGIFTGNGEKVKYNYNGNGANPTGDALVIDSCNYPNGINDVSVSGGQFKSTNAEAIACYTSNGGTPVEGFVTGGKYSTEPNSSYVATDYMAVGIVGETYHYQVGYAIVETGNPEIKDATATYTVNTVVKEDKTSTEDPLETINNLTVTVTGTKAETTNEGNAGVAVAALSNIKDNATLGDIVTEAIETAGAKIEGSSDAVSVVIQVVKSAVDDSVSGKATYEVHPEAVVIVNSVKVGTFELTNGQLNENNTFSFKLYAKAIENVVSGDKIKVTHIHDDGSSEELGPYEVDNDGYIEVTGIKEFSKFTLEEVTVDPGTGSASFGYTIALEDSINIVYNVKNLSGTPADYTITYTDPDAGEEVTKQLTDSSLNSFVIAKCAAKEMGDVYSVVVKYKGTQINKTTKFSIKEYCVAIIGGSYGADIQNLCKSTLDYGSYAQKTFDYNTDKLVNGGKDYFTNENIVVPVYKGENTGTDGTIKTSLALVTTSKTQMVVYFRKADGTKFTEEELNGATVTVNGTSVVYTTEAGKVKVVITGISAKDLAGKKAVQFMQKNGSWWQLEASPVDYMGLAVSHNSQVDINRAFYNYYLKADTYFKNK